MGVGGFANMGEGVDELRLQSDARLRSRQTASTGREVSTA